MSYFCTAVPSKPQGRIAKAPLFCAYSSTKGEEKKHQKEK